MTVPTLGIGGMGANVRRLGLVMRWEDEPQRDSQLHMGCRIVVRSNSETSQTNEEDNGHQTGQNSSP